MRAAAIDADVEADRHGSGGVQWNSTPANEESASLVPEIPVSQLVFYWSIIGTLAQNLR
jgi:hypothetical protein